MTKNRWAKPDKKRSKPTFSKNEPKEKGVFMTCTGCGSEENFCKDYKNPNKEQYCTNKLRMIIEMKKYSQKFHLHSFYVQDEIELDIANEADNETPDSSDDHRFIAEELSQNIHGGNR